MSEVPRDLRYMSTHEWVRIEEKGIAVVGITDFAQRALGDLVYIEPPEMGAHLDAGEEAGVVESVKAASDIFAPMSGDIVAINEALEDEPETVNTDPYGEGWLYKIKYSDLTEFDGLLTPDDYSEHIEAEEEDEDD
jgi:glycine cleavage system H protein